MTTAMAPTARTGSPTEPDFTPLTEHWNAAYAAGDSAASWTQAHPTRSLQAIAAVSPDSDAPIIDVGGGSSPLAAELLRAGHSDVSVLDLSGAAISLAQRRLGDQADRVRWITADLLAWQPERRYAVWHDRAVLHFFTDPADRARYAETLVDALAPGSCAIIATFAPDGPTRCSGLPVQRYCAEDILTLLGPHFSVVSVHTETHHTPSGRRQPFTWVTARRTARPAPGNGMRRSRR